MSSALTFAGLPPLPENARAVLPFMLRAQEMASRDPPISYWCKMHAARVALSEASRIPEIRPWLIALMNHLESEKTRLHDNEFVSDENVGAAHVENFALKIFAVADREDRAGNASMRTAKTYLAASNYLEVMAVFKDELDSDTRDKIKYAKFKAADIVKALKSGVKPTAGPPLGAPNDDEFVYMPASPSARADPAAGPWSAPSPLIPPPSAFPPRVSSAFPDGSSSSAFGTAAPSPFAPQPPTDPYFHALPPTAAGPLAPPGSYPSAPPPPQSYPSAAASDSYSSSSYTTITTTVATPTSGGSPALAHDPAVMAQAQKFARFAISAIEYDDISTAADNLRKALALIAPYEHRK